MYRLKNIRTDSKDIQEEGDKIGKMKHGAQD